MQRSFNRPQVAFLLRWRSLVSDAVASSSGLSPPPVLRQSVDSWFIRNFLLIYLMHQCRWSWGSRLCSKVYSGLPETLDNFTNLFVQVHNIWCSRQHLSTFDPYCSVQLVPEIICSFELLIPRTIGRVLHWLRCIARLNILGCYDFAYRRCKVRAFEMGRGQGGKLTRVPGFDGDKSPYNRGATKEPKPSFFPGTTDVLEGPG